VVAIVEVTVEAMAGVVEEAIVVVAGLLLSVEYSWVE
jgi:hypothetical protein